MHKGVLPRPKSSSQPPAANPRLLPKPLIHQPSATLHSAPCHPLPCCPDRPASTLPRQLLTWPGAYSSPLSSLSTESTGTGRFGCRCLRRLLLAGLGCTAAGSAVRLQQGGMRGKYGFRGRAGAGQRRQAAHAHAWWEQTGLCCSGKARNPILPGIKPGGGAPAVPSISLTATHPPTHPAVGGAGAARTPMLIDQNKTRTWPERCLPRPLLLPPAR